MGEEMCARNFSTIHKCNNLLEKDWETLKRKIRRQIREKE